MRSIPLHSLVLVVGPQSEAKKHLIDEKFRYSEVESCERIASDIYGDPIRTENVDMLMAEIYHRAKLKLSLGERVIIDAPFLQSKSRLTAADLGHKFGAPTFYVISRCEQNDFIDAKEYEQFCNIKQEIFSGDSITNVID